MLDERHKTPRCGPEQIWDILVRQIVFQRGKHLTSFYEERFRLFYSGSTSTRPDVDELEPSRVNTQAVDMPKAVAIFETLSSPVSAGAASTPVRSNGISHQAAGTTSAPTSATTGPPCVVSSAGVITRASQRRNRSDP